MTMRIGWNPTTLGHLTIQKVHSPFPHLLESVLCLSLLSLSTVAEETRDPWLQPFAVDSIWNTPLGAGADYHGEGHFKREGVVKSDTEFHYKASPAAPARAVHEPRGWPVVDGSHGKRLRDIFIDDDVVVRVHSSNNCAAILQPDGDKLEQLEPFIRYEPGGIALGLPAPFWGLSLRGDGRTGSHWGSRLSALGGSLRHGHLSGEIPINFVTKFNCQGVKYLHYDKNSPTPGYQWPAHNADKYAGEDSDDGGYSADDPRFVMGSLLAIAPHHTAESLGLKTKPARLLFAALRDYGAYIVDDSGDDSYHFSLSYEAEGEFQETYGFPFGVGPDSKGAAGEWYEDFMALVSHLSVVANNREDNVGGGGTPRAPLAVSLGEMDNTRPTPPSPPGITGTGPLSADLEWSGGGHPLGISNYWIYGNGEKVAETFGNTSVTVTGLVPDTEYEFTVRTRARNLMLSPRTQGVFAKTKPVAPGTVLQDFDSGEAPGWRFEGGAAIRAGRMELDNWKGIASAVLANPELPAAYTLKADLDVTGSGSGNLTIIHLDYHHYNATVCIEIPGGGEPVKLRQRSERRDTVLATAPAWKKPRSFSLSVTAEPRTVALSAIVDGKPVTVLPATELPPSTGGHLAFATLANRAVFDNVYLKPSKPSSEKPISHPSEP